MVKKRKRFGIFNFQRYMGIVLILLGLVGVLGVMQGVPVGYTIFTGIDKIQSSSTMYYANDNLEVSKLDTLVGYGGGKVNLILNAKNIGEVFLNNCKLASGGDFGSWIYSGEGKGLSSGEKINLNFEINIPKESMVTNYSGKIGVKCDETELMQDVNLIVYRGLNSIIINSVENSEEGLNVSYGFDRTGLIGKMDVDIWVVDSSGNEIKKIRDSFDLNKDGIINRKIFVKTGIIPEGVYSIYFSLASDPNNYVEQSFIVTKKASVSGNAVFGTQEETNKTLSYIVFGLIIGIGVLFAIRGSFFSSENQEGSEEK